MLPPARLGLMLTLLIAACWFCDGDIGSRVSVLVSSLVAATLSALIFSLDAFSMAVEPNVATRLTTDGTTTMRIRLRTAMVLEEQK